MGTQAANPGESATIEKIVVRVHVGGDRMAASDDPFFLRLGGPAGREFRLAPARGRALRRDAKDEFVFGRPDSADTNVAHPELNDPTSPPLALCDIERVSLHKAMEPIPNVRGLGELDDRLQIESIEVDLHPASGSPVRFRREGPLWLGLVSGLSAELARIDGA